MRAIVVVINRSRRHGANGRVFAVDASASAVRTSSDPGRLVIVEPIAQNRRQTSRAQQRSNHEIAIDYVAEDLRQAGFEIVERRDRFIENLLDRDTEWLIVATPLY